MSIWTKFLFLRTHSTRQCHDLPFTPASGSTKLVEEAEEHDIREEERDDGAQINNLVELGFFFLKKKYFT